jgi:hypothetical protein
MQPLPSVISVFSVFSVDSVDSVDRNFYGQFPPMVRPPSTTMVCPVM